MTSDDAQLESDGADQPDSVGPEAQAPAAASGPTGWIAAGVAGVIAVGAIAAAVVFFLQNSSKAEKLDAIADSTKAACDYAAVLVNYDYAKDLDGYIAAMKAGATGEFLKEFSVASEELRVAMVQAQISSTGEDVQCAYMSGNTDEAKAMVTMTQSRINITQTEPQRMMFPIEMSLVRTGDKWLVNRLDSPLLDYSGDLTGGALGGQPAPAPEQAPAPAPGN
ncbi:hypothetical protein ACFWUP_22285 [Nocardia sp. NPDC058658]|uniref:hypothetical protein n=1 Tax=Nocardia sp. NPDC058658 TaxID=3346580 RepID=UPI00364FC9FA